MEARVLGTNMSIRIGPGTSRRIGLPDFVSGAVANLRRYNFDQISQQAGAATLPPQPGTYLRFPNTALRLQPSAARQVPIQREVPADNNSFRIRSRARCWCFRCLRQDALH